MSAESETASRYRARAQALNAIADGTRDALSKAALDELADEYERLAAIVEAIDNSKHLIALFGNSSH